MPVCFLFYGNKNGQKILVRYFLKFFFVSLQCENMNRK